MNIKGLSINKTIGLKLLKSIDSITVNELKGINSLRSFSWEGFVKQEFKNLLILLFELIDRGMFDHVDNFHNFVFNYSTDVTEMDIVTVLHFGEEPLFIDIESKNGDDEDLINKIDNQLSNRINNQIPQMIKGNGKYVVMGYVNNVFYKAYYYDGKEHIDYNSEKALIDFLSALSGFDNGEEYLLQTSNLATITKTCELIQKGTYKYYEDTNKAYASLVEELKRNDVCLIYGNAGTGKSVLALKSFFELENTKLLLVNSKFYYSLGFNCYYSDEKATYNHHKFLEMIDKNTISIVDECQRIDYSTLVKIIQKSKATIAFGDHKQAFTDHSILDNIKNLAKKLENEYGFKVYKRELKKARRYSDEVDKALSMLTNSSKEKSIFKLSKEYEINLFYDEDSFIKKYESVNGIKKIYTPIRNAKDVIEISGKSFIKANYKDDSFSVWASSINYYGVTYHALSFDIDHCFVYLDSVSMIKFQKESYIFTDNYFESVDYNAIQLFLNELNILFTRGKKSLNIYVKDIRVYLHLNNIIKKL